MFPYKKGPAQGLTALILVVLCVLAVNIGFYAAQEFGIIEEPDSWLKLAIYGAILNIFGLFIAIILARNLVKQGERKQIAKQKGF